MELTRPVFVLIYYTTLATILAFILIHMNYLFCYLHIAVKCCSFGHCCSHRRRNREARGARAPQYILKALILQHRSLHPLCTYMVAANYVDETNVLTRLCKRTFSIGCVHGECWGTYKTMYFWHRLFWCRRWYIC